MKLTSQICDGVPGPCDAACTQSSTGSSGSRRVLFDERERLSSEQAVSTLLSAALLGETDTAAICACASPGGVLGPPRRAHPATGRAKTHGRTLRIGAGNPLCLCLQFGVRFCSSTVEKHKLRGPPMRRGGSSERPRHLIRRDRDGGIQAFSCVIGLRHVTSRHAITRYVKYRNRR